MKIRFLLMFLATCAHVVADAESRAEYLILIQKYPKIVQPIGDATKGEIEILIDADSLERVEKATGLDVGVLKRDRNWIWLSDACRFGSNHEGVASRIVSSTLQNAHSGAAVLPIMPDGKVVLNCEFRHATRTWELEMPRGGVKIGETAQQAACREVLEETGYVVGDLVFLGEAAGDSGIVGMTLPIFVAKVTGSQSVERDNEEAIDQNFILSVDEIKQAFARGYVECVIAGETRRVYARDPFLAYALMLLGCRPFRPL